MNIVNKRTLYKVKEREGLMILEGDLVFSTFLESFQGFVVYNNEFIGEFFISQNIKGNFNKNLIDVSPEYLEKLDIFLNKIVTTLLDKIKNE